MAFLELQDKLPTVARASRPQQALALRDLHLGNSLTQISLGQDWHAQKWPEMQVLLLQHSLVK
jgi:hypothetical protein